MIALFHPGVISLALLITYAIYCIVQAARDLLDNPHSIVSHNADFVIARTFLLGIHLKFKKDPDADRYVSRWGHVLPGFLLRYLLERENERITQKELALIEKKRIKEIWQNK